MVVVLQLETTPDHCRLFVDKARREDSGNYTITAENPYGKDSASIEVSMCMRTHAHTHVCVYSRSFI